MDSREERLVLVAGNGRSGTLTMKHQLNKALGLEVGHEYVRKDGCCSLYFFDESIESYPVIPWGPPKGLNAHVGQRMKDFRFNAILHQVRHPLKVIPSMSMIYSRPIMDWFEENGLCSNDMKNRLHKCMAIWLETNIRTEKIAHYRYRIEDIAKAWPKICRRLGFNPRLHPMAEVGEKHRATGSRKRVVSWDELKNVDSKLTTEIRKMSRRYGYHD